MNSIPRHKGFFLFGLFLEKRPHREDSPVDQALPGEFVWPEFKSKAHKTVPLKI